MAIKPFSLSYVMKVTLKHIRQAIEVSIHKTSDRWEDFPEDDEKRNEVTRTLMLLHGLRKLIDDFNKQHSDKIKESTDGTDSPQE